MPFFQTRGQLLLSLVPKNAIDSGDEDDDGDENNVNDDELDRRIEDLFDVIGTTADELEADAFPDIALLQSDQDSDGPLQEELEEVVIEPTSNVPSMSIEEFSDARPSSSKQRQKRTVPDDAETPPSKKRSAASNNSNINSRKLQGAKQGQSKTKRTQMKPRATLQRTTVVSMKGSVKKKKMVFKWKREKLRSEVSLPETTKLLVDPTSDEGPLTYFKRFFSDELMTMIVEESNRYSVQKNGVSAAITLNDFRDFLSIAISMGVIKIRCWKSYWSHRTRVDRVAKVMSRNKYAKIRSVLHFVNNDDIKDDDDDKYKKIRPVMEYIRKKFCEIDGIDRKFSVDEMMVAYKGRKAGSRRQYMPKKPTKWGFKFFVRSGISGIVYDFFPYAGDESFLHINFSEAEKNETFSSKCVLALCKTIKNSPLSAVFFDNFFSSPRLMNILRWEYGILSLGTMRANRLEKANEVLKQDKALQKQGRGSFDEVFDNKHQVAIVKWVDTKIVTLGSTYTSATPVSTISRWSAEERCRIDIDCPNIVKEYNTFMGGVDKSDMLVALYKSPLRMFKWYMAIFIHLVDLSLNNAWLLYLKDHPDRCMPLSNFKLDVADALLLHRRSSKKTGTGPSPNVSQDVRLDGFDHFAEFGGRGKCKLCKTNQTSIACPKCQVRLCIQPSRNCFLRYHSEKVLPKRRKYQKKNGNHDSIDNEDCEDCDEITCYDSDDGCDN